MPPTILDNLEEMQKIDLSNMLGYCVNQAESYADAAVNAAKIQLDYPKPQNVIIAGMGGSGIGGELVKDLVRDQSQVPIEVSKDYWLPAYAGKNTLAIFVSYSGETEETLASFLDARLKKCMIYCISSGGRLLELAENLSVPFHRVPSAMPPRAALPQLLVPLLKLIEKAQIASNTLADLEDAVQTVKKVAQKNSPERQVHLNQAKKLALDLNNFAPVIYSFGMYRGAALRWKQQFNENSKIPAKWEVFSELNHNEIVGWEKPGNLANSYAAVFLRDMQEPEKIRNRIEITKALMQPNLSKWFEIYAEGKNGLAKVLSTICLGDFTSVYLALLHGVDPTPVKTISSLKTQLAEIGLKKKVEEPQAQTK